MNLLKTSLFFTLIFQASWSIAQPNSLLKCLGNEELYIHKYRITGPAYTLNQELIGLFLNANKVEIKDQYFGKICGNNKQSASVSLLRQILTKKEKLFKINPTPAKGDLTKTFVQEIIQSSTEIFINYISALQSSTPKAGCLEEKIPELKFFLQRFRNLQTVIDIDLIMKNGKSIDRIFNELKRYSIIYQECKALAEKEKELYKSGRLER